MIIERDGFARKNHGDLSTEALLFGGCLNMGYATKIAILYHREKVTVGSIGVPGCDTFFPDQIEYLCRVQEVAEVHTVFFFRELFPAGTSLLICNLASLLDCCMLRI